MSPILLKLTVTAGAMVLWFLSQKWIGKLARPNQNSTQSLKISDAIHVWTAPLNQRLNLNPRLANFLLISSSMIIDLLGLYLMAQSIFGPSLRPLVNLILVFTLRQLCQVITQLPVPEGMIWRNPGVPSIFVTYGVSNDLFFSGHTALAVLGALEIYKLGSPMFLWLALLIVVFEIGVVLILRAHWAIDVFAAVITALLISALSSPLVLALDGFLKSMS